jgi:Uma2 family endonuclease
MSAVPKARLTEDEYLAIERSATVRSEYLNGEMFAMAGGTIRHSVVKDNLVRRIGNALDGSPCRTVSADVKVKVSATGLYTYPDVIIVCGEPQADRKNQDVLLNPHVILEVLSKSTESYDRGQKFRHFRTVESLREFILVSQWDPYVERFHRQADGSWALTVFEGLDTTFHFASVNAELTLGDIYQNVTFAERELSLLPSPEE